MSNINITRSGPEVMADNPSADTRRTDLVSAAGTDYRPEPRYPDDWRVKSAHYAGSALLILIIALVFGLAYFFQCGLPWLLWYEDSRSCETWRTTASYIPGAIAIGAIVYLGYRLFFGIRQNAVAVQRGQIENARFNLLPDRFGNPTPATLYDGMTPEERFSSYFSLLQLATELKRDTAKHEEFPASLNTLSISNAHTNNQNLLEGPEGEEMISIVPDTQWLPWINRTPHLLVAGRTGAGKTTFASAILADRILAGDQVLVLDPHHQPGKWFGIPAVVHIPDILNMLAPLIDEMDNRYEEFHAGKPEEEFERITVLIDEVPAIVDSCMDWSNSGRARITDHRWKRFTKRLGSEARKVRISVILLTQSTLVQDLLINSKGRDNFILVGLGDQARPLISSEEAKRKQQLYGLLQGQKHPASIEHEGMFYILDTSNVRSLSERSVRRHVRLWDHTTVIRRNEQTTDSDQYDDEDDQDDLSSNKKKIMKKDHLDRLPSGLSTLRTIKKPANAAMGIVQTDRQTDRPAWDYAKKIAVLRELRKAGLTRNQARERLERIGQGFNNDDWTIAAS